MEADDFNKSVSRHDLNQSSRLDLDWDPDASDVGDDLMSRIIESGSDADSSASPASLGSSHASSEGSFDRGQGGKEPQHKQAATNERSAHNSRNGEQTTQEQNDGMVRCPPGSSHKNQNQSVLSRSAVTGKPSGEEEKIDREKRKLIKIKLWDPGDKTGDKPTKSSTITVAVNDEVASIIQANEDKSMHQIGLGTKQNIHLEETASGGRDTAVDVMWQPNAGMGADEEEKWERDWAPPSIELPPQVRKLVSDTRESGVKERDASPQQMPSGESSTPQPKSSSSNKLKQQQEPSKNVKGLEPFTIPSILSSTVVKRTPTEKIGLAFRKSNGTIVIEKIAPGSAFDGSALRPGHECLCINGTRLRSARRAAEIVRETASELTLMASNAPRPPGTMYTIISLRNLDLTSGDDFAAGMKFSMKHGLVQLVDATIDCPVNGTSLKIGDFILAINGAVVGNVQTAVGVLVKSRDNDTVPLLYFNMRHLRVSLVDKVIGNNWKKEWSNAYDECVVSQSSGPSRPLILKFSENGIELSFRDFRSDNGSPVVPSHHPLLSVVDVLNHGINCVLSAIRQGVEKMHGGDDSRSLAKLSQLYHEGLLSKDDFGALKTRLMK
ncbi:hypothetical protein THAOC_05153 [Thalassiosira oceanica]|uniref:PDZ domain-containing protein n=1 Tax=Thalassiosira oceanica TaxID=159749 RepID=K0TN69_THAOC|nr:hypothetical protein THAOC_05153 [Thalassiosira oceanica]|mmetsp:Transcript_21172/g.49708  ORF Transcript_21172/g.49708 Transcript_21172/m.49708 type:complete len:609 (-) Transcript_21172:24-1850(-)|eukprot:EJK73232.1 hypothetical protein THAOC_05153 [Thalassiosira oceanica]